MLLRDHESHDRGLPEDRPFGPAGRFRPLPPPVAHRRRIRAFSIGKGLHCAGRNRSPSRASGGMLHERPGGCAGRLRRSARTTALGQAGAVKPAPVCPNRAGGPASNAALVFIRGECRRRGQPLKERFRSEAKRCSACRSASRCTDRRRSTGSTMAANLSCAESGGTGIKNSFNSFRLIVG